MQRSIQSKALSLILTLMLCFGVFATVQMASTTVWAGTIADGAGRQYEINFATNGNTATLNGITATTDFEVDLEGDGWGWNPETNKSEQGERISFAVHFSGNAEVDGRLTVTITGTAEKGGTFTDSFNVYVKEGKPVENNIDNTQFFHLSMKAMKAYGGLNDLKIALDFDSMPTYELYLSNLDRIELNGVQFTFSAGGNGGGGGYFAADEYVGLDLWAWGTPIRAGIYTINVSSEKAGIKATRVFDVNAKVGQNVGENLMEERDIDHETGFMMPNKDVDDFVFTVIFTPSGGGASTSTSSSKGSSNSSGSNSTLSSTPAPAPVNTATAVQNVKDAVAAAKNSPNGAAVNLKNPTTVSLKTLREMAKAAGNTPLKLNADSLNTDGSIDVRITIDPSKAIQDLNLSASTTSYEAKKVESIFEKYFDNNLSVVNLSQKGNFGMPVQVAAKIDSKLNTSTLVFYSYDSQTNTYTKIANPQYRIDKNGYVHFTTSLGGDIIISDKPLERK